jgi:hypothetical protein
MRPHGSLRFAFVMAAVPASAWIVQARGPDDRPDITALVAQVGERVTAYYHRAQQLICLERSTVVPIDSDWSIQGFSRTVESELRVELDGMDGDSVPDAHVTRDIRSVNGREPRERDRNSRAGCTDPTPVSPEPLAFLLPGHREEYTFIAVHEDTQGHRAALAIDFRSALRKSKPELIEDPQGHEDCFDWKGPVEITGRVWVDAVTYDVLRVDRHVAGPTSVRVPVPLQQKYHFDMWLTLDRDDLSLRYKEVAFQDPDEVALLPESSEELLVFRGGLQSMRTTQGFSDYRRFLTDGRIKIQN